MAKKQITDRELVVQNWTSLSFAMDRLELYFRFLPVHHSRAIDYQDKVGNNKPVTPFIFKPRTGPLVDIPVLVGKEWILYMQSPLMEWETYWECVYKSIYIMNYISGYTALSNAKAIYQHNLSYLQSLEDARHTFAHFVKWLPTAKDVGNEKARMGISFGPKSYSFKGSKWDTTEDELNKFLSILSDFISATEKDFACWSKSLPKPNNE
ncbi:hypothetical protein [Geothrix paludis]|uniref:hypothetical protein n=1 Tax=Geothrix paludis TaxID=2922722 RepID=UPI001FAC35C9|nr:hypothetical protein [Geothrix paludis]